ncbi:hypothetical protein CSKR_106904, partial [Clonorchis sinensis]
ISWQDTAALRRRNTLPVRLLNTLRKLTTGFALLGTDQLCAVPEFPNTLICKSISFCERLTWNPAISPVFDVSRQLNVLHQAASCSSCYDIRDIAIHQLEHEAAWCSTFSCLRTSKTGDPAGFQVSLSQKPN